MSVHALDAVVFRIHYKILMRTFFSFWHNNCTYKMTLSTSSFMGLLLISFQLFISQGFAPSVGLTSPAFTVGQFSTSALNVVANPKVVSSSSIITEEEVLAAHKAWGDGLCLISKTDEEKGYAEAKKVAQQVLDAAYGYAKGIPVLFKPTLASGEQTFRLTNEGALSYFVGGFPEYPNDGGFAIMGWRKVESFPEGILLNGNTAISTGNVHCTNKDGKTTIVDKTWAYKKDNEGNVRIVLHHSSLPYSA
jgi:hypothetical protein